MCYNLYLQRVTKRRDSLAGIDQQEWEQESTERTHTRARHVSPPTQADKATHRKARLVAACVCQPTTVSLCNTSGTVSVSVFRMATMLWALLPVISQFSLTETQKIVLNIHNFSMCTGTTACGAPAAVFILSKLCNQGFPGPFLSHPLIRGSALFWTLLQDLIRGCAGFSILLISVSYTHLTLPTKA